MKNKFSRGAIPFFIMVIFSPSIVQAVNYTCDSYTHTDFINVAPYKHPAVVGTANYSASGTGTNGFFHRDFITLGNTYRFRQKGVATSVKLFFQNPYGYASGVYIKVRRKNGSVFDLVATSENILPSLGTGASVYTVNFSDPLTNIQEGDYYGYRIEANLPAVVINKNFFSAQPVSAESGTNIISQIDPGSSFARETSPSVSVSPFAVPMEFTMINPDVAFIGDSIIAGHPGHYSYLEKLSKSNPTSTISYNFGLLTSYTTQNFGIGGQTTTQIAARFNSDVLGVKPRIIVIEGGVNDIAQGLSQATFTNNVQSMVSAAQADPTVQKIILLGILPWTNGTSQQNTNVNTRNDVLTNIAASHGKATYVSAASQVGQFRAGGPAGNLRDIQPAYNADGVHFTSAGHAKIAQSIRNILCNPLLPLASSPANGSHITQQSFTLSGTGTVGDTITLKNNSNVIVATTAVNGVGSWNIPTVSVVTGSNTFSYVASDSAGNTTTSQQYTIILDTPAPPPPPPPGTGVIATGGVNSGVIIPPVLPPVTGIVPAPIIPIGPLPISELESAFVRSQEIGVTNATQKYNEKNFSIALTRAELARIMTIFEKNVRKKTIIHNPLCTMSHFADASSMSLDMQKYVQEACDMRIIGRKNNKSSPLPKFRPYDIVTRAELAAVLVRYFYGDYNGQMGSNRYTSYLNVLKSKKIMNVISNPLMQEKKGYVILMLQRYVESFQ